VAPSLVTVTSPISSTNILSNPCGPKDVLTIFAIAFTAILLFDLTSIPYSLSPAIPIFDMFFSKKNLL